MTSQVVKTLILRRKCVTQSLFFVLIVFAALLMFTHYTDRFDDTGHDDVVPVTSRPPTLLKHSPTTDNVVMKKRSARKMVIVLTYMRSGSSFTGDIIQQNPDVFYVYEPIHSLSKFLHQKTPLLFLNKKKEMPTPHTELETIKSFLTCDVENIDLHTLHQFHLTNSKTTKPYYKCAFAMQGINHIKNCLTLLSDACTSADVISLKTIRMEMTSMRSLLEEFPQLKIVHLVRDPRAMLLSQRRLGRYKWEDLEEYSQTNCLQITQDLLVARNISRKFPDRIYTLRYEDLADEPIRVSRNLYRFLGMEFTDEIKSYIWNITSAGHPDGCNICTTRNNSTETAYKWRKQLDFGTVFKIDNICSNVYKIMGYLRVPDKSVLENMSFSLKTHHV